MTKQYTNGATTVLPFPWTMDLNGSALKNFTRTAETCQKAYLAWQQEMARFAIARWQRDSEAAQKLLASPNWTEAMKVQQEWLTSAGQDYFDETNRLVQLAQTVGSEAMHLADTRQAAE